MDTFDLYEYEHGGDWSGFLEERGRFPLDFSANVSPLGLPPKARKALSACLLPSGNMVPLSVYPDPACRGLRRAIAMKYGLASEEIFCANGAADILYRLAFAKRPARALLAAPDFGEYARALKAAGTEISYFDMSGTAMSGCGDCEKTRDAEPDLKSSEDEFILTDAFIDRIREETDIVIFSNPNNPSGTAADPGLMDRILDRCIACDALLVVDECFLDFLPDAANRTMLRRLPGSEGHLLVLRAFTKFYGMAGLRLGWCASLSGDLISRLQRFGPPWQVSTAAQAAGTAALSDMRYEEDLRALIAEERTYLAESLGALGFHVVRGRANYLLFYSRDPSLAERLLDRGVMIRDCSNYPGLSRGWYRTAVRLHRENEVLVGILAELSGETSADPVSEHVPSERADTEVRA